MNGLLFITHCTDRYTYLQSAEIALKGGCKNIQLRMKDSPVAEVEQTAIKTKELCDAYGAQLYIDDHVQVCLNVKATGVHLGKLDMPPAEARKILGNNFVIGGTANTFEDIRHLVSQGVDYIGLGPFRFTTTKKNLSPVLGLSGYQEIIAQCRLHSIDIPILAIGGITLNDIPVLMRTGIAGIALSSTILQADDPIMETNRILTFI
ncbi:thiamine phosphate synthase [Bacteroides sp. 519]|uniref:thiamine phosphate synthase n=1 Tax=Bacteroides sp. 519 TaxID=2302937 RepID=UPI0013D5687A|nr:thiamine phosphate synthase [Bacteroides sp. 519]NDV59885.1 thiamine phosphate synthase [Bacteroides sp. 519]